MGRSRFDLRRTVEEATAEMVPRALAAGIDLGMADLGAVAPQPVMVDANALLIREAVNVVDNADPLRGPRGRGHRAGAGGPEGHRRGRGLRPRHPAGTLPGGARALLPRDTRGQRLRPTGSRSWKEIVECYDGRVELHSRIPRGLRVHDPAASRASLSAPRPTRIVNDKLTNHRRFHSWISPPAIATKSMKITLTRCVDDPSGLLRPRQGTPSTSSTMNEPSGSCAPTYGAALLSH